MHPATPCELKKKNPANLKNIYIKNCNIHNRHSPAYNNQCNLISRILH